MLPRRQFISLTCAVAHFGLHSISTSRCRHSSLILRSPLIFVKRRMFSTKVEKCSDVTAPGYDAVVVVAPTVSLAPESVRQALKAVVDVDAKAEAGVFLVPSTLPSKRVVFSSTGPLDRDYDDVRRFEEAAEKGVSRAIEAGAKKPLLCFQNPKEKVFPNAGIVSLLGALKAAYVPIEVREEVPDRSKNVDAIGIFGDVDIEKAQALEAGRLAARDIGGSDPERMAAPRVAEYVREMFKGTSVKVEVMEGQSNFEKNYPCLAAVNRAANSVPRHQGRVIWMEYMPEGGKVDKTLMLVGKGITYDTGGADIKAGGIMAGMSRDKGGASDVAGIMKTISMLKPKNLKVVGAMAMVRNSVGEECYVADEIITSRAGVRIRVGNTDAEGRMAMVDVLCDMKERALKEINPHIMTIATLTGHAVLANGPYTNVMDNGPAKREAFAQGLQSTGDLFGDMFEISTIRREDFDFIKDGSGKFVEVLQCNNAASSRTPRGHQFPAAFMQVVAGLDKHMCHSVKPLKYSHLDVAGSNGELPGLTTGSSVIALAMHFAN